MKGLVRLPADFRCQAGNLPHDGSEQPFRPVKFIQPLALLLKPFDFIVDFPAASVACCPVLTVAPDDIFNPFHCSSDFQAYQLQ